MASITTKPSCNRQGNVCCYNHYLGPTSNICSECRHGYFGWNCRHECKSGFYGRLCVNPCECPATECNHVTGCINGLKSTQTSESTQYTSTMKIIRNTYNPIGVYSAPSPADRHHHTDWASVSGSLIGSLAILFLIGWLIYFSHTISMPDRKSIRRIFLSCRDSERNRRQIQGQDIELSAVSPSRLCRRDGGVNVEPSYPQYSGTCPEQCVNTVCEDPREKGYSSSTEPRNISKYNTYRKCTFRSDYDHVNLKTKLSSVIQSFDKEFEVIYNDNDEFDIHMDRKNGQCGSEHHDGYAHNSMTLPRCLKHVTEKKTMTWGSLSLCHISSAIDFRKSESGGENSKKYRTREDDQCATSNINLHVHTPVRPYSLVHALSCDNLRAEEEVNKDTKLFKVATPELGKTLNGRPYSFANSMK